MGTLYIAAYEVVDPYILDPFGHIYLVYDPDDDPVNTTTDQLIIRGGPTNPGSNPFAWGLIEVEAGESSANSSDGLDRALDEDANGYNEQDKNEDGVIDTAVDRDYTSYGAFTGIWGALVSYANDLAVNNFSYDLDDHNSNAVINTVLNIAGINMRDVLPTGWDAADFPSHTSILGSSVDRIYTAFYNLFLGDVDWNYFYKGNADDYVILEYDTGNHAKLEVRNTNDETGLTTIYMDGLNFDDVDFVRIIDRLGVFIDNDETVIIKDFYSSKTNSLADGAETTAFEFQDLYYRLGDNTNNTLDSSGIKKSVRIDGFEGNDILWGGRNNDILRGGADNDMLYGGLGDDTADYSGDAADGGTGGTQVTLGVNSYVSVVDGFGDADQLRSVERLILTGVNDTVTYDGYNEFKISYINGGGGSDTYTHKGYSLSYVQKDGDIWRFFNATSHELVLESFETVRVSAAAGYFSTLLPNMQSGMTPVNLMTSDTGGTTLISNVDYSAASGSGTFNFGVSGQDDNTVNIGGVSQVLRSPMSVYTSNQTNTIDIAYGSSLMTLYTRAANDNDYSYSMKRAA